jgi:hypothetical protein
MLVTGFWRLVAGRWLLLTSHWISIFSRKAPIFLYLIEALNLQIKIVASNLQIIIPTVSRFSGSKNQHPEKTSQKQEARSQWPETSSKRPADRNPLVPNQSEC